MSASDPEFVEQRLMNSNSEHLHIPNQPDRLHIQLAPYVTAEHRVPTRIVSSSSGVHHISWVADFTNHGPDAWAADFQRHHQAPDAWADEFNQVQNAEFSAHSRHHHLTHSNVYCVLGSSLSSRRWIAWAGPAWPPLPPWSRAVCSPTPWPKTKVLQQG